MNWQDLSMRQRAAVFQYALSKNIPIPDIKRQFENGGVVRLLQNEVNQPYRIFAEGGNTYTVKSGDSLWNIARHNNITLDELREYNPQVKGDMIHPNDVLNVAPAPVPTHTEWVNIDDQAAQEAEMNKSNLSAIQGANHKGNYVVVDKAGQTVTVYDKNNNPLYQSNGISTGISQQDYNTITYVESNGTIKNHAGNESTPAGITTISGVGTYHGFPCFTRARVDSQNKMQTTKNKVGDIVADDLASSMHYGNVSKKNLSNGCVRMDGATLQDLSQFIGKGTTVYTLPQQAGSKFTLRDGKLSFTAENPYGIEVFKAKERDKYKSDEEYQNALEKEKISRASYALKYPEGDFDEAYRKRHWDDYNTNVDMTYSPLLIQPNARYDIQSDSRFSNRGVGSIGGSNMDDSLRDEYDGNVAAFSNVIMGSKQEIMNKFGIDSKTYNDLAKVAMGIAEQESNFGTGNKFFFKRDHPDLVSSAKEVEKYMKSHWAAFKGDYAKYREIEDSKVSVNSVGATQIKMAADNDKMQQLYSEYGLNEENVYQDISKSALATILRLASMYKNEVQGRSFTGEKGVHIDPMDALLYKWNGKNKQLTQHTATPEQNIYIQNVKRYMSNFDYFSGREVEDAPSNVETQGYKMPTFGR